MQTHVTPLAEGGEKWREMPESDLPSFDMEKFAEKYQASAAIQAAVLGEAFSTLQIRMDAGFALVNHRFDLVNDRFDRVNDRFDRIERVLALAYPDEYRQAFSENGHNPPEQGGQ